MLCVGSAKNCRAAQLPANHGAATAPDAPASPRMRHDKAHRTDRTQEMFSGGATQRIEPGSSNKRIRSRLRATYPYSLDPTGCAVGKCEVLCQPLVLDVLHRHELQMAATLARTFQKTMGILDLRPRTELDGHVFFV